MYSYDHHVYGSTREKLIFALEECCLFLLCTKVIVAATCAHVGLFINWCNGHTLKVRHCCKNRQGGWNPSDF